MTRAPSGRRLTRASRIAVVLLALVVTSCDRSSPAPLRPTPTPQPPAPPVPVTGAHVLTGLIFELTSRGPAPVADAQVDVAICPDQPVQEYAQATTDQAGTYRVAGMCVGTTYLWAGRTGYRINRKGASQCDGDCVYVSITQDTSFDIELVRE